MAQLQSGTRRLRENIWHCIPLAVSISHVPPPTLPIFPKTEFRTRSRASLKHIENQERIKILWKDPLLQHFLMNRPELHA